MPDILDVIDGSTRQTYRGIYFSEPVMAATVEDVIDGVITVEDVAAVGFAFLYEYANPNSRKFSQPLQNLMESGNRISAIKTNAGESFTPRGMIKAQDGYFYQILEIQQDMTRASRQAAFFVPTPAGAEYLIRMTRVENPFAEFSAKADYSSEEEVQSITTAG